MDVEISAIEIITLVLASAAFLTSMGALLFELVVHFEKFVDANWRAIFLVFMGGVSALMFIFFGATLLNALDYAPDSPEMDNGYRVLGIVWGMLAFCLLVLFFAGKFYSSSKRSHESLAWIALFFLPLIVGSTLLTPTEDSRVLGRIGAFAIIFVGVYGSLRLFVREGFLMEKRRRMDQEQAARRDRETPS
jgi:hypothetical protein